MVRSRMAWLKSTPTFFPINTRCDETLVFRFLDNIRVSSLKKCHSIPPIIEGFLSIPDSTRV